MIIEWPETVVPANMNWQLVSNSKTFTSPFTGSSQTVRFPGSRWRCTLTFSNLTELLSRELEVLVASLDGESGRVKISNWIRPGLKDKGSPIVSAPNQTGRSLQTKGWISNSIVLRKGDYLTIGNELKMSTENVISDSNGNALITLSPILRTSPAVNEKIETVKPFGIFKLTSNDQGSFQYRPGNFSNVTLSLEEALY
ncbi:phage protein [Providencia sneebia DSM 19967]|uniref:Phage protein n=2 Tax=Providencia sneebia TaxID=516075 RepID=K8WGZ4_9GAMM|nr:phage protein [Providencia sneebia DSM 19967]